MPRGRPKTKHLGKAGRPSLKIIERKPIRPLERQRMRPWLINLLDQNTCDQLEWLSRDMNTFRISWKHAAGQTFDANADATLFELWARHTGKFYPGDRPDPKKWKANFRCAMHSLPDVEEDKSLGVRRGNSAFRVYRFLEEKRVRKSAVKKEKDDRSSDEEDGGCSEEYVVLRNLGTKSRPRKVEYDDLDSEGSETAYSRTDSEGYSPSHSDHSDWALPNEDLRRQDHETETESKSPLPNFEELCQSTPALIPKVPKKQKRIPEIIPFEQMVKPEPMDTFAEHQYTIILEDQDMHNGLEESDTSAEMDFCVLNVNFDDQEVAEATQYIDQEIWNSQVDLQEEVVVSGNEGPSVIVLEERGDSECDYAYTSLSDL